MKTCLKLVLAGAVMAMTQGAHAQMYGPNFFPFPPMPLQPGHVFLPPPLFLQPPPPVFVPPSQTIYVPPMTAPEVWGQAAGIAGVNHEGQVAAECVAQYGPSKAGATCIATRLSVDEIEKCFNDGIGGRGCFGDNNTVVQILRANLEAAQRESDPASAWVRLSTGVSFGDILDKGPLGGENSDARKLCNDIGGMFGLEC